MSLLFKIFSLFFHNQIQEVWEKGFESGRHCKHYKDFMEIGTFNLKTGQVKMILDSKTALNMDKMSKISRMLNED